MVRMVERSRKKKYFGTFTGEDMVDIAVLGVLLILTVIPLVPPPP